MCLFILVWIPKGRATASATAPSWLLAGLIHVLVGGISVIVSAQQWSLRLGGVVLVTLSTTSGVGVIFAIGNFSSAKLKTVFHYTFPYYSMFAAHVVSYDTYDIWTSLKTVLMLLNINQPLPTFGKLTALSFNDLQSPTISCLLNVNGLLHK
jgi:hypothetical protein